ncbi:hypothetical protein I4U23_007740 [Adineta vaga]|nr:hypothetical protein I4U23_007740 [Adineta vaga]
MSGLTKSDSAPSQSISDRANDYRQQRETLVPTEDSWRKLLQEGGIKAVLQKKKELDDQWRKQPVLIAVIGQTGSGKSTLIRRLLGYQPDDLDGPTIGESIGECTKEAKEYLKADTGLVYIDLPGVGSTTAAFAFNTSTDQDAYFKRFKLEKIDYFLLLSQNKFNEQEKLLAEYIKKKLNKKFSFIQTKMDQLRGEFGNKKIERHQGFQAVKDMIREDIKKQLDLDSAERIFLISNDVIEVERNGQQR